MKVFSRLIFLITIACLLHSCKVTDDESPRPNEVFLKFYGDINDHQAKDLIINQEGQYVMFGTKVFVDSSARNGRDFYIVVADDAGNQLRHASIPYPVAAGENENTDQIAGKIKSVENGEYLIIGTIRELDEQLVAQRERLYVARLNASLEEIARLEIGINDINNVEVGENEELNVGGLDVVQNDDRSIVIIGYSDMATNASSTPLATDLSSEVLVAKYRLEAGDVERVWLKTYGDATTDDRGMSIHILPSGEFFAVSQTGLRGRSSADAIATGTNVKCQILTDLGIENGEGAYGIEGFDVNSGNTEDVFSNFNDVPNNVYVEEGTGFFTIVGTSTLGVNTYPFFMKVSRSAVLEAAGLLYPNFEIEGQVNNNATGEGITRAPDGNYVVAGSIENFSEQDIGTEPIFVGSEMLFIKTSQSGNAIEGLSRHFGIQSGDDIAVDVLTAPDGKIVMLGTAEYGPSTRLFSLIKLNSNGKIAR